MNGTLICRRDGAAGTRFHCCGAGLSGQHHIHQRQSKIARGNIGRKVYATQEAIAESDDPAIVLSLEQCAYQVVRIDLGYQTVSLRVIKQLSQSSLEIRRTVL